ncbi:helix-turn-helix domain-containing protein [Tumebacillus flagellatus]|uniref:HTH cro/C1-type domain-containing protein n=1 Tax=Tumebacillus flagellatus TaxID=1157490 RepID=A0A074LQU7_9BACL|nr:helix-turn-helix transcriptional regulator [Tumebacillus flagellatus]KEO84501.1 hypothetical protein EL26_05215 [Tumebacillus flagellatus]
MSTIEHTATASIGRIPMGRRLSELLKERGDAFSARAVAERIGLNREKLRKMLVGQHPVTVQILEQIADDLKLPVERIMQLDTVKSEKELKTLLDADKRTKVMMLRALTLANELVDASVGFTERCFSFANRGRAEFQLQKYDEAHESWQTAMKYAEKVSKEFDDFTLLHHVSSFLMISYTIRREYTNILHTLSIVETAFKDDPEKMGYANYVRMKWQEHRGDMIKAKEYSYIALEFFKRTGKMDQIGRAMINVGHFEFHTGNYEVAKQILWSAIEVLESFDYPRLFAVKDYVKALLKLGQKSSASELIREFSHLASDYPDIHGKLMILYSMAADDPTYAVSVSDDLSQGVSVRYSACKYLMEYYTLERDSESVMQYYEKGRAIIKQKSGLIDEEGF